MPQWAHAYCGPQMLGTYHCPHSCRRAGRLGAACEEGWRRTEALTMCSMQMLISPSL